MNFLNEYISGRTLPGVEPLKVGTPLVVMGDFNADSEKGEGIREAIRRLLENPALNRLVPSRPTFLEGGGVEAAPLGRKGLCLKLDYIMPSRNFAVLNHEVFWPEEAEWWKQVRLASDHFMVYADCSLV